jgi:Flp pilus assembly protein TadG
MMPQSASNPVRALWRSQQGGSAIEFALVAPLFIGCLFALFQVGLGIYAQSTIAQLAERGARHLLFAPGDVVGARQTIIDSAAATGLDTRRLAISMATLSAPYPHVELKLDYRFQAQGPVPLPQDFPLSSVVLIPIEQI